MVALDWTVSSVITALLLAIAAQGFAAECKHSYTLQPSAEKLCNPWPLIDKNGKRFQLFCSASLPHPSTHCQTNVTWFKSQLTNIKHTKISPSNSTIVEKLECSRHGVLAIESSITIVNAAEEDVGCYWCTIAVSAPASTEYSYQLQPSAAFCLFHEDDVQYKSVSVCEAIPHHHMENNYTQTGDYNSSQMLPRVHSNKEDNDRLKRETIMNTQRSNHQNSSHISHGDQPTQGMTIGLLIGIIICVLLFIAIVVMLAAVVVLCGKKTSCQHIQDSAAERKILTHNLRQSASRDCPSRRGQNDAYPRSAALTNPIGAYYLLQVAGDRLRMETDDSLSHHSSSFPHTSSTSPSDSLLLTPASSTVLSQHAFHADTQVNASSCTSGGGGGNHDHTDCSTVGVSNGFCSNRKNDWSDQLQSGRGDQRDDCGGTGGEGDRRSGKLHHYHVLEKPSYSNWTMISNVQEQLAGEHQDMVKKERTLPAEKMLEIAEEGNYDFDPAFVLQLKAELGSRSASVHSTSTELGRSSHYAQLDWSTVQCQSPYTKLTSRKS